MISEERGSPDSAPSLSEAGARDRTGLQNGLAFPEFCHLGLAGSCRGILGWYL